MASPIMDMLKREEIAEARLTEWRTLAQELHARYPVTPVLHDRARVRAS